MNIGMAAVVVIIVALIILNSIIKLTLKVIGIGVLILVAVCTIWVCTVKPELHKPFSLNTIEYLLKINHDGSVSTTKQITQTVLKQETDE